MRYKAFLFDLNGTMIDDMNYHVNAWHRILNDRGANLSLEQTRKECYGRNDEILERIFPGRFSPQEKDRISIEKETQYQADYKSQLKLIHGLDQYLLSNWEKGIRMAIGSAAILFNVNFVIDGLRIRHYFDAIISASDVLHSKPDPETFTKCAAALGMDPKECLVFEDVPKGVESAHRAGMDCAVITTMHAPEDFAVYPNIIAFAKDYTEPALVF